jgi:exopolyphosphatase/guanosine-5'-triphosphate,3'-diphosphate pyrophosphatase
MPASAKEFPKKTIAAIDVGTNSAHMVIAEMDHVGEMRLLDTDKVTLRLGQAIDPEGNISADGIRRTVETLSHMRQIITPYKAQVRAIATHAVREARNFRRLLSEVEKASGIKIQVIDGVEEARLVFLGMRYGLALAGTPCLAVDDDISYVTSMKLGAVTLTEKHFRKGYTSKALGDLKDHVETILAPLGEEARRLVFTKALASSGTAKALAFLHSRLTGGPAISDPNGYVLTREGLEDVAKTLGKLLTPQKIKDELGLDGARSEIILAGTVVLEQLTKLFKVKEWVITTFGLREGIVADTFYRAYGPRSGELPDIQWHSVLQLARRLQLNEVHANHVKRLALRLHEQLIHFIKDRDDPEQVDADVKLLKAACYLREAGKFISAPQYHKHSQYLLTNSRLPGFTESERNLMGLIARFQRKGVPSSDHDDCRDLSGKEVNRLRFLAAIVRLSAALDRTRQGRVLDIEVTAKDDRMTMTLIHHPSLSPIVELHKAQLEQAALEKSFDHKLTFQTRAGVG